MRFMNLALLLGHFTLLAMLSMASVVAQNDEQDIPLLAGEDLQLDFAIDKGQFSFDGSLAVVWGKKIEETERAEVVGTEMVAIVDLVAMKVLRQQNYGARVKSAAICEDYVYVAPKSGNLIYRYDHDFKNSKRVFTPFSCTKLFALPNQRIGVPANTLGGLATINTDTMQVELAVDPNKPNSYRQTTLPSTSRQLFTPFTLLPNNRVQIQEQVFDLETNEVLNFDLALLPEAGVRKNLTSKRLIRNEELKVFGRRISRQKIVDHNRVVTGNLDNPLGSRLGSWTQFSSRQPILYSLIPVRGPRHSETFCLLETRQLYDGKVLDTKRLNLKVARTAEIATIQSFADKLVVLHSNRIATYPLPVIPDNEVDPVLYLSDLPIQVLDLAKTKKIPINCEGGKGKLRFELLVEYPGLSIDGSTGQVTIVGKEILEDFLQETKHSPSLRFERTLDRFESELARVSPEDYCAALGQEIPAGKIPMSLPLCINVSDEMGQSDSIRTRVVGMFPRKEIEDLIAEARKPFEDRAPAARANQASRDADRIAKLESRLESLEELLETVSEKLDEANKKNAAK